MYTGTVKFFSKLKNFGFVVNDETGEEVFFHVSGLIEPVDRNDKVSFVLKENRGKMIASEIKKLAY